MAALVVTFYSGEILPESDLITELAMYLKRSRHGPPRRGTAERLLISLGPKGREVADAIRAEKSANEKRRAEAAKSL